MPPSFIDARDAGPVCALSTLTQSRVPVPRGSGSPSIASQAPLATSICARLWRRTQCNASI